MMEEWKNYISEIMMAYYPGTEGGTNSYELLGDFKNGIITIDILGKAFEPEQRFEDLDGTAIIFNRDFMGEHRGLDTIPGPFAVVEEAPKKLW